MAPCGIPYVDLDLERDRGGDESGVARHGEITELANLPEVLYLYRVHSKSVNVRQMEETRMQCAFAVRCAELRRDRLPETSFDSFLAERDDSPVWERVAEFLDVAALRQYRLALPDLLGGRPVRGFARLAASGLISPRWTAQYVRKLVRRPLRTR